MAPITFKYPQLITGQNATFWHRIDRKRSTVRSAFTRNWQKEIVYWIETAEGKKKDCSRIKEREREKKNEITID